MQPMHLRHKNILFSLIIYFKRINYLAFLKTLQILAMQSKIDRNDWSQRKRKVEHNALWYMLCCILHFLADVVVYPDILCMHTNILYTKYRLRSTHCRNSTPFQTQPIRKAAWASLPGRERDDYVIEHSTCSAHRRCIPVGSPKTSSCSSAPEAGQWHHPEDKTHGGGKTVTQQLLKCSSKHWLPQL